MGLVAVVPGLLHATRLVSEAVAKSRYLLSAQQTLATGRSPEKSVHRRVRNADLCPQWAQVYDARDLYRKKKYQDWGCVDTDQLQAFTARMEEINE